MDNQLIADILCNVKNKMKEYFFLKDETYDQTTIDNKTNDLTSQINNKSKVSFARTLSTGTKIGQITIDGTKTDMYCEKNTDTQYTPASGTPLKDEKVGKVGTSNKYAREDHIHPTDKTKVEFNRTLNSGTKIGEIKINDINTPIYCETNTDTIYAHPNNHNTNMIIDTNSYANIGNNKNDTQTIINTKINEKLGQKVDKNGSKVLSDNNYTTTEKNKLASLNNYSHPTYSNVAKTNKQIYKTKINELGHVYESEAISKSDIVALGIPAQDTTYSTVTPSSTTSGLMSPEDKRRLDVQSTYQMFLTTDELGNNPPSSNTMTVTRPSAIYAMVLSNGTVVENKKINFIINGTTYERTLNPDMMGKAKMDISTQLPAGTYTVIAQFRENGWTVASDIKTLKVQ